MPKFLSFMHEAFLQYVWKNIDFNKENLIADTGEKITIYSVGELNTNQGPDFINAKIEIDGTQWAGNVEIHTDSDNWYKHKHHQNSGYDNVILHVVSTFGKAVFNAKERRIPTIQLPYPKELEEKYNKLLQQNSFVPCADELSSLDSFRIKFWLESLTIERIESKTALIQNYLNITKNDWNEAFYIGLCRNFGLNVNADSFEQLARSIPLKIINKHHKNILQLEALLFGQSGLISKNSTDHYVASLQKEYQFLQHKYQLSPVENTIWNFHRLRPMNFPTVRIAQLAALIHTSSHLFSKILEAKSVKSLQKLFTAQVSSYWHTHYQFSTESEAVTKNIGKQLIGTILINTVVPFLFIYGKQNGNSAYCDKALQILTDLPAEKNRIIKQWEEIGIKSLNSGTSQALLHLKKNYCDKKQCLHCQIGHLILSKG